MTTNIIRIIPAVVEQEAVKIGRVEMALYWLDGDCAETVAKTYGRMDTRRQKRWGRCKVPHVADSCRACGWRREFKGADLGARRKSVIMGVEKFLRMKGERPAFAAELEKPPKALREVTYQRWVPNLNDWGFSALALARQDKDALQHMLQLMEERGHKPFFQRVNGVRTWSV